MVIYLWLNKEMTIEHGMYGMIQARPTRSAIEDSTLTAVAIDGAHDRFKLLLKSQFKLGT